MWDVDIRMLAMVGVSKLFVTHVGFVSGARYAQEVCDPRYING